MRRFLCGKKDKSVTVTLPHYIIILDCENALRVKNHDYVKQTLLCVIISCRVGVKLLKEINNYQSIEQIHT